MFAPKDWSKVSNEDLVTELRWAASVGNEYDNRSNTQDAQTEVLRRLASEYSRGRAAGRADVAKYSNAIGCIEAAIGYSGARKLSETVKAIVTLVAEHNQYRNALEDFAEYDCHYGDNCPTFGSRHGQCVGCKARKALK